MFTVCAVIFDFLLIDLIVKSSQTCESLSFSVLSISISNMEKKKCVLKYKSIILNSEFHLKVPQCSPLIERSLDFMFHATKLSLLFLYFIGVLSRLFPLRARQTLNNPKAFL